MHLIPKPNFWICIYLFQKDLFRPKSILIFDLDKVRFPFLNGGFPRYEVYTFHIIRFARSNFEKKTKFMLPIALLEKLSD